MNLICIIHSNLRQQEQPKYFHLAYFAIDKNVFESSAHDVIYFIWCALTIEITVNIYCVHM